MNCWLLAWNVIAQAVSRFSHLEESVLTPIYLQGVRFLYYCPTMSSADYHCYYKITKSNISRGHIHCSKLNVLYFIFHFWERFENFTRNYILFNTFTNTTDNVNVTCITTKYLLFHLVFPETPFKYCLYILLGISRVRSSRRKLNMYILFRSPSSFEGLTSYSL